MGRRLAYWRLCDLWRWKVNAIEEPSDEVRSVLAWLALHAGQCDADEEHCDTPDDIAWCRYEAVMYRRAIALLSFRRLRGVIFDARGEFPGFDGRTQPYIEVYRPEEAEGEPPEQVKHVTILLDTWPSALEKAGL